MYVFFFVKQKTAYEVRISDWSSDVCSSDLAGLAGSGVMDAMSAKPIGGRHRSNRCIRYRYRATAAPAAAIPAPGRSEEHTSELQSLMRISYAVFCLKKKKSNTIYRSSITHI